MFYKNNGKASRFEAITPNPDQIEKIINRVGYWKIENGEKQFSLRICKFWNNIRNILRARKGQK